MDKNNQPGCPPRLASFDVALDHKITNQYTNSSQIRSSIYTPNVPVPVQNGNPYGSVSQPQNNYYSSMSRPNPVPSYPRVPQQRMNSSNTGDLSMQPINNYAQSLPSSHNINMINPIPNNSNYSDFNNNFYQNKQSSKYGFLDVVPNLKSMFKQNKLSKWTLIFIIVQVIVIVILETLLFINYKYFYFKFHDIKVIYESDKFNTTNEFDKNYNQSKCLIIYQLIFIVAQIFVLIIYYDSFRISSSIQLITISIFNFIISGYSCIQIFQTKNLFDKISITDEIKSSNDNELINYWETDKYKQIFGFVIAIASVLSFSALALLIMSFFLFKKFGWNIYRNVGADIKKTAILKRRYKFGIVLKFKIFFIFGIIAQCVLFINNNAIIEWNDILESISTIIRSYATYALSIILIINIICGYFTIRKQSKFLMVIYILTDMIFIIFSTYMIYFIFSENEFKAVRISLTGFATIEIVILLISLYFSTSVMMDIDENFEIIKENESKIGRRLSL
ncbi:hypothetical protein H8356DRAFT_944849 [Neocallimastix lanati (nom. inval.)]|jgi:hypothetical protein|nr:hypothetical protein H8356DRAFT_944849 [Neocallimastix sp. JGI-2020a]